MRRPKGTREAPFASDWAAKHAARSPGIGERAERELEERLQPETDRCQQPGVRERPTEQLHVQRNRDAARPLTQHEREGRDVRGPERSGALGSGRHGRLRGTARSVSSGGAPYTAPR